MSATLQSIAQIARDAARESGDWEVLGVIPAEGDTYVEILLSVKDCRLEPCRLSLGVLRDLPEDDMQRAIVEQLRSHVTRHSP